MGIFPPAFRASACREGERGSIEARGGEGEKLSGDVPPNESSSCARPEIGIESALTMNTAYIVILTTLEL